MITSAVDSSHPKPRVEDPDEVQILEQLAQDIRRLLQNPGADAGHVLADAAAHAASPAKAVGIQSLAGNGAGLNRQKGEAELGSNQLVQAELNPCKTTTKGSTHSILKTGNQKRFTTAEKEKWVAETSPPRTPWKAFKDVQSTSTLEAHRVQEESNKGGEPSWRREGRESWTEVKGPY